MIKPQHLKENIIIPVLDMMGSFNPKLADPKAVELLLGTAAQESDLGYFLVQEGASNGAKGIFQMEDPTHDDIVNRYLERPENAVLKQLLQSLAPPNPSATHLIGNHYYATFLARLKYWMEPAPIPETLEGQAEYYKTVYNTSGGAATVEEYLQSFERFLGDGY